MTKNYDCVEISRISLPKIPVTKASNKVVEYLASTIKHGVIHDAAVVVVVASPEGSRFVIVDRLDVYEAAKKHGLKKINVLIVPMDVDPLVTHLRHTSVKGVVNPIKKRRALVGLEQSDSVKRQLLQMERYYLQLMTMTIPRKTEASLEKLIDALILVGVQVLPPLKFIKVLLNFSAEEQLKVLQSIFKIRNTCTVENFSWPDKAIMLWLIDPDVNTHKTIGHKQAIATQFQCPGCNKELSYTTKGVEVLVDHGSYHMSHTLGEDTITLHSKDVQDIIEDPSKKTNIHVLKVDDLSKLSLNKKMPAIVIFDNHRV